MLNKNGKSVYPCLVLCLRGNIFSFEYDINYGFVIYGLYDFEVYSLWASLVTQLVKNLPAIQEIWVQSLGQEEPLEKGMATLSSILAWRILWTEEPGDWATNTFTSLFHIFSMPTLWKVFFLLKYFIFLILFLNCAILYWFCQVSKWIRHRYTCVPHPEKI